MRIAFFDALVAVASRDDRIWLLTGDLGFGAVEPFASRFPQRFINVGVAEQNMTGIATGLALTNKIVFTYSIANFPTLRCLEQIRNGPCYHNVSVKVVSVGGGLAYGALGMSHHATEDLAIMRALPNMTVVAPGDPLETSLATAAVTEVKGPCYLRLGRAGEPIVHKTTPEFAIGKAITVMEGSDLTVISTGTMLRAAVRAAEVLKREGTNCRVVSMPTLRPLDTEAVRAAARETPLVVTMEEHSIVGGLGGAVAEVLAEMTDRRAVLKRIGLPSAFAGAIGSQAFLLHQFGLSDDAIIHQLRAAREFAAPSA